jgi:hypothetical protein
VHSSSTVSPVHATQWQQIYQRAALVVFGLGLPLIMLEVVLRAFGPRLPGDYQTASFSTAESAGQQIRPYAAGYKKTSEFTTQVRVNSKRLRGPEIDYEKPPVTHRTVILGDSFMFALQVDEEETFASRLGVYLTQTTGADVSFEMVNGGADGWTTANEYTWLTSEGYRYDPDLVVLTYFYGNDPGENADRVATIAPGGRIVARGLDTSPWQSARLFLSERSLAWNLLEFGVLAKLPVQPVARPDRRTETALRDPGEDRKERGWKLSEDLLVLLRDYCEKHGIRLLIVGIPTLSQVAAVEEPVTTLAEIGCRIDVPTVDLLEPLEEAARAGSDDLYFPKDQHWTAEGHDVAARTVAAELRQRALVPEASRR